MTEWQPIQTAPRDRMILIHCGNSRAVPVKICRWSGGWVNVADGRPILHPTGWAPIPDWSGQPTVKIKKNYIPPVRDLAVYKRRMAGETNEAIANTYKISAGRISQIFQRVNKKMFDMDFGL